MAENSAAVARAHELDAEGRHDDAVNELALAVQRKDVEATTALAKRLIVGDRAPRLRRQGIGMLKDAVNLGDGEAAERLAVIFVSGIAGAPDWLSALRLLALAAERGWNSAGRQLDVIASLTRDQGHELTTGESLKRTLLQAPDDVADSVDLGALFVAPAGSDLCDDPRIRCFPDFVGKPVCDWLIGRARGRLERALVYDVVKQVDFADESRTNSGATFHIMEADLVHLLVQSRISAACGQPVAHMEAPTVLHYAVGEAIGDHYDFVDPEQPNYEEEIRTRGTRVLTFLVYLNDDYEGGETTFPKLELSHWGQLGEGMFFVNTHADGRADVRTLHNGQPPTRGEKWIFSQFVRDRPESIAD